jgi:hypothetical protein
MARSWDVYNEVIRVYKVFEYKIYPIYALNLNEVFMYS